MIRLHPVAHLQKYSVHGAGFVLVRITKVLKYIEKLSDQGVRKISQNEPRDKVRTDEIHSEFFATEISLSKPYNIQLSAIGFVVDKTIIVNNSF